MKIGSCSIAAGRVFIIAELGVNHDGDEARAIELVEAAARAGADAIKVQHFETDLLLSRQAGLAEYQENAGEDNAVSMLKRLELSIESLARIAGRSRDLDLAAIATVFSCELIEESQNVGWDAYKTASPDIINKPLIEGLAGTGRPLLLSTGAADLDEVLRAHEWLSACGAVREAAFLQCVSAYPTPTERSGVNVIPTLMSALAPAAIGYSDHTMDVETGANAVRAGAILLEKHLTYDREARGPDHAASLDEAGMKRYVELARRAATNVDGRVETIEAEPKRVLDIEENVRCVARQSVAAARTIEAGARLVREDLMTRRPGVGIEPARLDELVGAVAGRKIMAGSLVVEEDFR